MANRLIRRLPIFVLLLLAITVLHPGALAAEGGIDVDARAQQASFVPGDRVELSVAATYPGAGPVLQVRRTAVEVSDATGRRFIRDKLVDIGSGRFTFAFELPQAAAIGDWTVVATVWDRTGREGGGSVVLPVAADEEPCPDLDLDGHADAECGGDDCDDRDPSVHPGAADTCGDGVDQDCSGADLPCAGDPHAALSWSGPATCLQCHEQEAREVHGSVMYQWQGEAPFMADGGPRQGKIAGGLNSYCINIAGNWEGCGSCHVGLGARPEPIATAAQLANIDCMMCHQDAYRRARVDGRFVPDTAAMAVTMDEAVRTVHLPRRTNCLQCHAKAGGGDAVKRGDLALASGATTDRNYDVHMATTGADLACQDCHTFTAHRVAGKGSDLRPTDSPVVLECTNCHAAMTTRDGHEGEVVERHVARVACQTCHIPVYAKDAADTAASEATEQHRTWLDSHSTQPPFHPASLKGNDLVPVYRFWNRFSRNALLGQPADFDPETGRYATSRPLGGVGDAASKLYPFKYKTAEQPIATATGQLIALDTSVFFATADPDAATRQGLVNMGLDANQPYAWVETDTFQLLNHQVSPTSAALACGDCHGAGARMNLVEDLGYGLKDDASVICAQCHGRKESKPFAVIHDKHVKDKGYDCSWCHGFSRPERNLRRPG